MDVVVYSGAPCGVAASIMAVRQGAKVLPLQKKLRAQQQVIDFIPGKPETCGQLNGPPEF